MVSGSTPPKEVSGTRLVTIGVTVIVIVSAIVVGLRWAAGIPPVLRPDLLPTLDGGQGAPPLPLDPSSPTPPSTPADLPH